MSKQSLSIKSQGGVRERLEAWAHNNKLVLRREISAREVLGAQRQIFIDFRRAYDNIDHSILFIEFGVPAELVRTRITKATMTDLSSLLGI